MIERESETSHWTDDRVESLLVDFFAEEMPPSLRSTRGSSARLPRPAPVVTRQPPGTVPREGRGAAVAVAVAVLGVIAAASLFRPSSTSDDHAASPLGQQNRRSAVLDEDASPAADAANDELYVERVEGHVEPLGSERFDTMRGPVEMRAVRETTNVSVFDDETGQAVDLESQVLDIEIVPIEDADEADAPRPPASEEDELPIPRPEPVRLPEER